MEGRGEINGATSLLGYTLPSSDKTTSYLEINLFFLNLFGCSLIALKNKTTQKIHSEILMWDDSFQRQT